MLSSNRPFPMISRLLVLVASMGFVACDGTEDPLSPSDESVALEPAFAALTAPSAALRLPRGRLVHPIHGAPRVLDATLFLQPLERGQETFGILPAGRTVLDVTHEIGELALHILTAP
jgi:hypothetical protein